MKKYKFDEIAFNSTKKKIPLEEDKEYYIGLEHLDTDSLKVNRYGSEVAPIGSKLLMSKGDVLFGKRRAYQKKVSIAPFDGIFSAHGMVLRPKEEVISKDFFPFFISSDYFLDAAIKISVGSLSPTINWTDLKELIFDIPDINIQNYYSPILWAMENLKESYIELLNNYDLLISSKFKKLLNEQKLEKKFCLKDITIPLKKSTEAASSGKQKGLYPFYTSTMKVSNYVDDYLYNDECIIIGNGGKASINYYNGKFSTTSHNYVYKNKDSNKYNIRFIYLYLLNNLDILEAGFKGVGLKNVAKKYVDEISIPYISIENQNKIISIIDKMIDAKNNTVQVLSKLNESKKILIKEIFEKEDNNV